MVKKRDNIKDNKKDRVIEDISDNYIDLLDIKSFIQLVKSEADKMYADLGVIDTKYIHKLIVLNDNPLFDIENLEDIHKKDNLDIQKTYLQMLDDVITDLSDEISADISKLSQKEIKESIDYINSVIKNYNNNLMLDTCIKNAYLQSAKFGDAIAKIQVQEIKDTIGVDAFYNLTDFDNLPFKSYVSPKLLQKVKNITKDMLDDIKKTKSLDELLELDISGLQQAENKDYLDSYIQQQRFKDMLVKARDKYNEINNLYNKYIDKYGTDNANESVNYDITKFGTNNDISIKLDPISKLLNGEYYKTDEIIKTKNNYNDKTYGAVFSIKTSTLSNIDIVDELKARGVKINHFGKKIIDDIDLLLDENKGNVNNNSRLVALTPKMIARKVYNIEQPTKKQQKEIESYLNYLNNIYLFFIKDNADTDKINKLRVLREKGIEILQDKEGNIVDIGDTLDDYIILNAKYGYSAKYQSAVYVFDNKSIFYRVNQYINGDINKQLSTSSTNNADVIFNDYNKNVNDVIVGVRYKLYERVSQIKHNLIQANKTNKQILLSNIYNEFDITNNKQKAVIRNAIKNTLNYWIDINYISGYKLLDSKDNEIKKNSTTEIYKLELDA